MEHKEKNSNKIIAGYAKCVECGETYPINNGIAVFLPNKWQNIKIWERSERVAVQKKGTGEKKNILVGENIDKPSEILKRIRIRNSQGEMRNEDLYKRYMEVIGMPDTLSKLCYLAQKCANEIDDMDYVLDFASGKCLLAEVLNEISNCRTIVSDINPIIVMQAQQEFKRSDNYDKLSFMAFDMKKSPFRNKSIHTVTTLLGLQNIIPSKGIVDEIDRISDVFFTISAYLTEKLPENMTVLNKFHIADVWIEHNFAKETDRLGWKCERICSFMDLAKGISREEIETRFAVAKFPVKDEMVKYALMKYLIGGKTEKNIGSNRVYQN